MARRLTYLKFLRKTHLLASMVVFVMLLMYAFSGLVMSQFKWIDEGRTLSDTSMYVLDHKPDTSDLNKLAKLIKVRYGVTGRTVSWKNGDGSIEFRYTRPGNVYQVWLSGQLDTIRLIRLRNTSFYETNKRLHRIHGYSKEWPYIFWAIMLDMTALGSMVFAVTGILIWWRNKRAFRWGWIFFLLPVILLIAMIIALYF